MNLIQPQPINPNIRFPKEFERAYDHVLDVFHNDSKNEIENVLVQRMYRHLYRFERVTSTDSDFIKWIESEDTRAIFCVLKDWLSETQRIVYPINHIHILNDDVDSLVIARHGLQLAMILLECLKDKDGTHAQQLAMKFIAKYGAIDDIVLPANIKRILEGMQ